MSYFYHEISMYFQLLLFKLVMFSLIDRSVYSICSIHFKCVIIKTRFYPLIILHLSFRQIITIINSFHILAVIIISYAPFKVQLPLKRIIKVLFYALMLHIIGLYIFEHLYIPLLSEVSPTSKSTQEMYSLVAFLLQSNTFFFKCCLAFRDFLQ